MRKLLFNLHLYVALIVGLFVVILSVTGAMAAFGPELDALFNPKLFHVEPQNTPPLPFHTLAGIVSRQFGEPVTTLRMPDRPDKSYSATVARGATQVFLNGYTGEILGTRSPKTFWAKTVQFHKRLAPAVGKGWPETGNKIVAIACWAMLFLLLSGLYLWWSYRRFSVKWSGSLRRVMFDLHNATGIYAFVFLLMLTLTGLVVSYDEEITLYLYKVTDTKPIARSMPSTPIAGATPIAPEEAVQVAKKELAGASPITVTLPTGPTGSYNITMHFPEDHTGRGTGLGRSWVSVDQYSGKATCGAEFSHGSRTHSDTHDQPSDPHGGYLRSSIQADCCAEQLTGTRAGCQRRYYVAETRKGEEEDYKRQCRRPRIVLA
jgi:uncharacterized iron-regulated membrane protein